jgi:hypothetical protein
MAKISVRHGVAQAYGLLFGQPFTVFGLTWMPTLFYGAAATWLVARMNAAMALSVPSAGGIMAEAPLFYFGLLVVASALFGGIIAVPLTRQAFGLREERVAAHFVFGAREARLSFALLRYYALMAVTLGFCVWFAVAANAQCERYEDAQGIALAWLGLPYFVWINAIAASFAVLSTLLYSVRFGFFIDAVASVEERAKFSRLRALSQGNFWRIALVALIVTVPAFLVFAACEMTFGGVAVAEQTFAAADPAKFATILAVSLAIVHALLAGASAAAYADLAEAAALENEPARETVYRFEQPAMAFAQAPAEPVDTAFGAAAAETPPMEIVAPEAESATFDWMPPPPDAHFGSDPHDAVAHAPELASAMEPLAHSAAELTGQAEMPVLPHPVEAQNALPEGSPPAAEPATVILPADGLSDVLQNIACQPNIAEAAAEANAVLTEPGSVPDHAHNAEFPIPPMPPAPVFEEARPAA